MTEDRTLPHKCTNNDNTYRGPVIINDITCNQNCAKKWLVFACLHDQNCKHGTNLKIEAPITGIPIVGFVIILRIHQETSTLNSEHIASERSPAEIRNSYIINKHVYIQKSFKTLAQ